MGKAEKTRAYIVEKTAPIFNTKGYAGTSINDMTEATGLTKGSIYGNFANKDEVAVAAFDHNLKIVQAILRDEFSRCTTNTDKLLVYTRVYGNILKRPFPQGGCPVLNTAIESDDTHPLLCERAVQAIRDWKRHIIRLIEKGKASKEFREDADPAKIALTLIALVEGSIMLAKLSGRSADQRIVLQSATEFVMSLKNK